MNHISYWNNMEKILSSRGFDHKIEQKYQPCRIGSLCDLGFFFCMNIYRWFLCWSLNIDIAYNQDPESCANISPNSRHCSLIFCYSNFHHRFLFSLYFTHFLPELVYLWCFLYLLKYNPHLNKALLFVNAFVDYSIHREIYSFIKSEEFLLPFLPTHMSNNW